MFLRLPFAALLVSEIVEYQYFMRQILQYRVSLFGLSIASSAMLGPRVFLFRQSQYILHFQATLSHISLIIHSPC